MATVANLTTSDFGGGYYLVTMDILFEKPIGTPIEWDGVQILNNNAPTVDAPNGWDPNFTLGQVPFKNIPQFAQDYANKMEEEYTPSINNP